MRLSPPTAHDVSSDFTYGPSGQIASLTVSNSLFENPPSYDVTRLYTVNGLNQLTQSVEGPATRNYSYDARGNLIGDGAVAYGYDRDNRLTSASGGSTFSYDPMGRLKETVGGVTTRFLYSGAQAVAEYDGSNNLQRRYVFGAGLDEVLVWYEGAGTSDRRFLVSDERGSITAVTDDSGAVLQVNKYDPYGVPEAGNLGRYQYTGQMWLDEAQLYFYKNRVYDPEIGRFLQTDPIGYADGMNLYAYVGGDPINGVDPWGLAVDEIKVRDRGTTKPNFTGWSSSWWGGYGTDYKDRAREARQDRREKREKQKAREEKECRRQLRDFLEGIIAETELAIGAQGGFQLQISEAAGISVFADAASLRAAYSTEALRRNRTSGIGYNPFGIPAVDITATQGAAVNLTVVGRTMGLPEFVGLNKIPADSTRRGDVGRDLRPENMLKNQAFSSSDPFVGISGRFGVVGTFGFKLGFSPSLAKPDCN